MTIARRAAVLAAALAVAAPAVALAHTEVRSSSPRDGAVLARTPAAMAVTFGEPIGRLGTMTMTRNGAGNLVKSARIAPRNARTALIALKRPGAAKQAGRYRLTWRITGADGHRLSGTITFRVRPR
jgi:methionine-rich copper-binding protein CopC